jgi:hypothetical protein
MALPYPVTALPYPVMARLDRATALSMALMQVARSSRICVRIRPLRGKISLPRHRPPPIKSGEGDDGKGKGLSLPCAYPDAHAVKPSHDGIGAVPGSQHC